MHCNDWGDRVQHDFYNSNLIFTIQIWSSAGNVQSINFHWFILLGYRGGGKVLVETHLSFFISLPGSLYEAQVDLFTGRTFSHKMLEVVAGAPFIIKWWMAVNSRVTRTQPPITPDMKLTPDFPESVLESWCEKVKRGFLWVQWGLCSLLCRLRGKDTYAAKTQSITMYSSGGVSPYQFMQI